MAARRGRVYAVERKDAAFDILRENLRRFHTDNVTPVSGTAPDACADLPAPTHAFLGGTTGHMKEIIALLLEKNPRVRIVATAVTLESVAELAECVKAFPFRETEAVSLHRRAQPQSRRVPSDDRPEPGIHFYHAGVKNRCTISSRC